MNVWSTIASQKVQDLARMWQLNGLIGVLPCVSVVRYLLHVRGSSEMEHTMQRREEVWGGPSGQARGKAEVVGPERILRPRPAFGCHSIHHPRPAQDLRVLTRSRCILLTLQPRDRSSYSRRSFLLTKSFPTARLARHAFPSTPPSAILCPT